MSLTPEERERHRRVELETLHDLHRTILTILPAEGSKLGYHPLALSAATIRKQLNAPLPVGVPKVTSGQVGSACNTLHRLGLVVRVALGGHLAWQVTPDGQELVREWTPPTFEAPPPPVFDSHPFRGGSE